MRKTKWARVHWFSCEMGGPVCVCVCVCCSSLAACVLTHSQPDLSESVC